MILNTPLVNDAFALSATRGEDNDRTLVALNANNMYALIRKGIVASSSWDDIFLFLAPVRFYLICFFFNLRENNAN